MNYKMWWLLLLIWHLHSEAVFIKVLQSFLRQSQSG